MSCFLLKLLDSNYLYRLVYYDLNGHFEAAASGDDPVLQDVFDLPPQFFKDIHAGSPLPPFVTIFVWHN